MAPTEAQKKARNEWDKKNTKTLGCKLLKDDAEAFQRYAHTQGRTVNDLLKSFVMRCIGKEE